MSSEDYRPVNYFAKPEPRRADLDFDTFLREVFGANQRAGAVVAVAQIDDVLSLAIKSRLRDLSAYAAKSIFEGASGPLSTLHGKIHIGYALALYTGAARDDLIVLKDVRNRFAHHIAATDFADPEVVKLCASLHHPAHRAKLREEPEDTGAWDRFHHTVGSMYFGLSMIAQNPVRPSLPERWKIIEYDRRPAPPTTSPGTARSTRTPRTAPTQGRSRPKKDGQPQS